ncbi:MAG: hypothetical protein ACM3QS_15110 [Bacteroidota bacterium]
MSRKDWLVLLLYLILAVAFFSPTLLAGRLPGPFEWLNAWAPWYDRNVSGTGNYLLSDQVDFHMPNLEYLRDSVLHGSFPVWNSELGFGTPFLFMEFIGHFYPANFVALVFPVEYFRLISAILKFLLMGFFTYKLLEEYKVSTVPAFMAGITVTFASIAIVWLGTVHVDSYSAIPFVFYAITRLMRESSRLSRGVFMLGVINIVLSGFPSIIFYAAFVAVFYLIACFPRRVFSKYVLLPALGGILSLMICVVPLFYTAQFLRSVSLGYRENTGRWHLFTRQALLVPFPLVFGNYARMADQKLGNFNESASYFGIFWLFLSTLSYFYLATSRSYRHNRMILFWTVIQLWSVFMIFDIGGILRIFSRLPLFAINPPMRLITVFTFSSAILGAFALDHALAKPPGNSDCERYFALIAYVLFIGFVLLFIRTRPLLKAEMVNWDNIKSQFVLLGVMLVVFLTTLSLQAQWRNAALGLLVLLVFGDLFMLGKDYNGSYTRESFYPRTQVMDYLATHMTDEDKIITVGRTIIPHTNLFYGFGSAQTHWWWTLDEKDVFRTIDSDYMTVRPTNDFIDAIDLRTDAGLLDWLNVKYIVVDEGTAKNMALEPGEYRRLDFPMDLSLIENLSTRYTPHAPLSGEHCVADRVYSYEYVNGHVSFQTDLCTPGDITLPIWAYPGWTLTSRSDPAITFSSKDDMINLSMPAGPQTVSLDYRPSRFSLLVAIMAAGVLFGLAFILSRRLDVPEVQASPAELESRLAGIRSE